MFSNCPSNIDRFLIAGQQDVVVEWDEPTASDPNAPNDEVEIRVTVNTRCQSIKGANGEKHYKPLNRGFFELKFLSL